MNRERLPNRRGNISIPFEFEGHGYRATFGTFPNGKLGELFLDVPGKLGTPLQSSADNQAILASLGLQYGIDPEVLRNAVTGPVAMALARFAEGT